MLRKGARERGRDGVDAPHHRLGEARRLVEAAEDAGERAGRADVGVMSDVGRGAWRFDVRAERALLAAFAEGDEHDEELRHQGQASAEATQPMHT